MNIKLLDEHNLEFLSLKEGYSGSSESIHVKMPHCWCAGWSEPLLVAHTTLLEISCRGSNNIALKDAIVWAAVTGI